MGQYDVLLAEVAAYPSELRALGFTALLTKALQDIDFQAPILVGGAAVEFWSAGQTTTADIDLILYTPHEKVDRTMSELGFVKGGARHWEHPVHSFFVEFPSDTLDAAFETETLQLDGGFEVQVVTAESIVVDRLASFSINGDFFEGARAVLVAHARGDRLRWDVVTRMAQECNVAQDLVDRFREYVEGHIDKSFPEEGQMHDEIYALYNPAAFANIKVEDPEDV